MSFISEAVGKQVRSAFKVKQHAVLMRCSAAFVGLCLREEVYFPRTWWNSREKSREWSPCWSERCSVKWNVRAEWVGYIAASRNESEEVGKKALTSSAHVQMEGVNLRMRRCRCRFSYHLLHLRYRDSAVIQLHRTLIAFIYEGVP